MLEHQMNVYVHTFIQTIQTINKKYNTMQQETYIDLAMEN